MPRLSLAFFASGFAALLCQVVWQRMLGLFAESDTVSAALVVGAFLIGLGIGTILAARVADRLSRTQAIIAFALCETGVAVFVLVSKLFLYDWLALEMAGRIDGTHCAAVGAQHRGCRVGRVAGRLGDAILPESSQSGVLYSTEFMQALRARLAPGGLYVQWAPSPRVVETFASVFPHVVLLRPISILIGSNDPIPYDRAALLARLASPEVAAHLARGRAGCCDWKSMLHEPARHWTPGMPRGAAPLTDLFPRDEFYLN